MKRILTYILFLSLCTSLLAQRRTISEVDYRRSSIYSLLIYHAEQDFGKNIADVFVDMPISDKYNDHDLSVKVIQTNSTLPSNEKGEQFLKNNHIAARLVGRWFNRDPQTGVCDMSLIAQRGLYDASEFKRQLAAQTVRGNAMLEDAGEELIHNTFVLVNDIVYIDQAPKAQAAGTAMSVFGALLGGVLGATVGGDVGNAVNSTTQVAASMVNTIKGFNVKVNTHLYRLKWDEETAQTFYETMYTDTADVEKVKTFNQQHDMFQLEYIGSQLSSGKNISFMGVNLDTPDQMVRKACTRAIDENIANLARNFEVFKTKVRLVSADPIKAPIGLKENISDKSRFEVLQQVEKDGRTTYKQVAVIKPVAGQIWDNRFMAGEENAANADIQYTTFTKVSGGHIDVGMLIRELK
ncbi:MAG: hypothetical protein IJS00_06380 [Paludibacteraceae bacterium]|nr:hypothetical protein [Paludibacteraceae bacterium]